MDEQVEDYQALYTAAIVHIFLHLLLTNNPLSLTANPLCTLKNRNLEKTTCLSGGKKAPNKNNKEESKLGLALGKVENSRTIPRL